MDYANAYAQTNLNEEVYIDFLKDYGSTNYLECVLKLNKSLYIMVQAPNYFFQLLKRKLQLCGFKQLKDIDPCLFVHKKTIWLIYVDDFLWCVTGETKLYELIDEMRDKRNLKLKSTDVSPFFGMQFTQEQDTIKLKTMGLIDKILAATGMDDCESTPTPADAKILEQNKDSAPFNEAWDYVSVL